MKTTSLLLTVVFIGYGAHADDYYWSGADGSLPLTNLQNWVDADGAAVTEIPGHEDVLHFDVDSALSVSHVGLRKGAEFAAFIHSGDANLTYAEVPPSDNEYLFYVPKLIRNETERSTFTVGGPNMRVAGNGSTNVIDVVNESAQIVWKGHVQTANDKLALIKRGKGTLSWMDSWSCYWGSKDAKLVVEEGTVLYRGHGSRSWENTQITFSGDKPGKTVHMKHKAYGAYGGLPGEYWSQYVFEVPLKEEGVTGNDHLLTSDNGAHLVYTGAVTRLEFSGRIGGNINVRWCPDAAEEDFVCSAGRSDTSGSFEVCSGGLVLTNSASFTSLGSLKVAAGARLHVTEGCSLRTASAVFGGTALADGIHTADSLGIEGVTGDGIIAVGTATSIAVPYSQSEKTASPVDLTDVVSLNAANVSALAPIDVALSHPIVITNGMLLTTGRWEVARFESDAALNADHFRDVSPKTCGLPHTWFEIEESGGVKRLVLVARPVVSSVEIEGRTSYYLTQHADMWSDGLLPHAGADYYCNIAFYRDGYDSKADGNVRYISDVDGSGAAVKFAGESLTFDRSRVGVCSERFDVDLRIYNSDSDIDDRFFSDRKTELRGRLYVDSSCKDPFYFYHVLGTYNEANRFVIASDIETEEALRLSCMWSRSQNALFSLLGDNSGIKNQVMFSGSYWNSEESVGWNKVEVAITNAAALGGPMEASTVAGVCFRHFPKLTVEGDVVYDTHNRNWYSENSGLRLEVPEGSEFSFMRTYYCYVTEDEKRDEAIPSCCAIDKTGGGVFALGGKITRWVGAESTDDGRDRLVRVKEGGVKALVPEAFDNLQVEFHDGTRIVADPEKTPDWGLKHSECAPLFAEGARVGLRAEIENADPHGMTVPFLTVSASVPDLSGHLVPEKIESDGTVYRGKLSSSNAVYRGRELTIYSVEYRRTALRVILR